MLNEVLLVITHYALDSCYAKYPVPTENKENFVCYNPRKSSLFMKQIIMSNTDIKFVPLINYGINELIEILLKSKIYVDFGFHPGVDHLPREAAILKNCINTNKEGSANYQDAVSINENFKFYEKGRCEI